MPARSFKRTKTWFFSDTTSAVLSVLSPMLTALELKHLSMCNQTLRTQCAALIFGRTLWLMSAVQEMTSESQARVRRVRVDALAKIPAGVTEVRLGRLDKLVGLDSLTNLTFLSLQTDFPLSLGMLPFGLTQLQLGYWFNHTIVAVERCLMV